MLAACRLNLPRALLASGAGLWTYQTLSFCHERADTPTGAIETRRRAGTPRILATSSGTSERKEPPKAVVAAIEGLSEDVELKLESEEENPFRDTPVRYAVYLSRIKSVLAKSLLGVKRYVAYSSDVGETLRPLTSPAFVTATYAIAGIYIVSDAFYCAYHEYDHHGATVEDAQLTLVHALLFQGVASLLIPMYTIHTVVHTTSHQFDRIKRFQRFGPSVCGFLVIPFLPLIDEPVEHLVDLLFENAGYLPQSRVRDREEAGH